MAGGLLILGAGGHGLSVADSALEDGKWESIYFLDDDPDKKEFFGFPVVGTFSDIEKFALRYPDAIAAVGSNDLRLRLHFRLKEIGYSTPAVIHPAACISRFSHIEKGCVCMAGAVVNAGTEIGEACILNTGCTVDHTCALEDGVHLSPGVHMGGDVKIGKRTWICTGVSVGNGIRIAQDCVIAAGAAVVKDVNIPGLYAGIPAELKKRYD